MHIIVLENEPSSFRGGQELSLLDVCLGLRQRGHQISLLYVKEGNLINCYKGFCTQIIQVSGYRIEGKKSIISTFNFVRDILKIPPRDYSCVYSNQYHDTFWGLALARSKNIPLVCHLRLPPPDIKLGFQWSIGMKGVRQFITISNQTKSEWVNQGLKEKAIEIIYNGVNLEVFRPTLNFSLTRKEWGISEDTRVISYVGRLDPEKGLETLIKAFALLHQQSANSVRLLIAGKPLLQGQNYKKSLKKLVNDLALENHVNFLSHVSNTTSVYQVSDVTVLPSLHSEPFGRVIIESMACGTPMVASRTGGIPEILTGEFQKFLFQPGNERELSETIKLIMNWRNTDSYLGEECRNHVSAQFGLETMIDRVEKVLLKTHERYV